MTCETTDRRLDRRSFLELQRAEIISDLEGYLAVLTDERAVSITQEIAGVLAFERLNRLRDIDIQIAEETLTDWYANGCKVLSEYLFFHSGPNRENVFRSEY